MVGMGFRRIALAQGLLDGPIDRNAPPPDRAGSDRQGAADLAAAKVAPLYANDRDPNDRAGKGTTADNRVRLSR